MNLIFGGNGDLCILLFAEDNKFEITKEYSEIYRAFEKLYNTIKNCQVVENRVFDLNMRLFSANKINSDIANSSLYKELFKNNNINYHSDNQVYEEATILKITPLKESYMLEFIPNKIDFMPSIEITNSGNRYGLLHMPFMNLYNALCMIDPNYHQIDIDEYMYVKKKQLR